MVYGHSFIGQRQVITSMGLWQAVSHSKFHRPSIQEIELIAIVFHIPRIQEIEPIASWFNRKSISLS